MGRRPSSCPEHSPLDDVLLVICRRQRCQAAPEAARRDLEEASFPSQWMLDDVRTPPPSVTAHRRRPRQRGRRRGGLDLRRGRVRRGRSTSAQPPRQGLGGRPVSPLRWIPDTMRTQHERAGRRRTPLTSNALTATRSWNRTTSPPLVAADADDAVQGLVLLVDCWPAGLRAAARSRDSSNLRRRDSTPGLRGSIWSAATRP